MRSILTKVTIAMFFLAVSKSVFAQSPIQRCREGSGASGIAACTQAIRINPRDEDAYLNRGLLRDRLGDHRRAIEDYTAVIALNPKGPSGYRLRAGSFYEEKDYGRMLSDLNQLIRLDSKNPESFIYRGKAFYNIGNFDRALEDFNAAIRLPSVRFSVVSALVLRAKVYERKDNLEQAVSDLSRAISLDVEPQNADIYYRRGVVQSKKGSIDNAISDLTKSVTMLGPNPWAADWIQDAKEQLALLLKQKTRHRPNQIGSNSPSTVSGSISQITSKRIALIIANSEYRNVSALENPIRDGHVVAASLRSAGFDEVTVVSNLSRGQMLKEINAFSARASQATWALLYFAGHGVEVSGINYLLPVDAAVVGENELSRQSVNINHFINAVEPASNLRLVILDACRDNPFISKAREIGASRGLAQIAISEIGTGLGRVEPKPGTLVVYSAKHGEIALDGEGQNSPFVEALTNRINQKPAIEIRRLFDFVREDVAQATKERQTPFAYGSLSAREDFYFPKQ